MSAADRCRCGHRDGDGPHPCHSGQYTCRRPAVPRVYADPTPHSLAGMTPKFSALRTWACDACWAAFVAKLTAPTIRGTHGKEATLRSDP